MRLASINMRQQLVAVLVPPDASLFELATPIAVWGSGRATLNGQSPFQLAVCTPDPHRRTESTAGIQLGGMDPLTAADRADLVLVPTWPVHGVSASLQEGCALIVEALVAANDRGATVVGLCLGAFAVAEAGLLEGRDAVTHWAHREHFRSRFPDVSYRDEALYVDHGDVVTSAGSAAALDCCLHLVRQVQGVEVATQIARSMVTPPHREGNQTQFVPPDQQHQRVGSLGTTLGFALKNLDSIHSVADLATGTGMSRRSLERAFALELAVSPAQWLGEQRVVRARLLLETTSMSIDEVAERSGLGSAPSLRRHFRSRLSTTPTAYRAAFGR